MKSIRVLLLLAVVQILFGSCLLWKETFLSLRQVNVYFLILIVGISGFCAGINYSQKKVWMVYTILLVVNLLASCLVLSESIQIHNKLQQDLVDLFLPSFFFLLGIDMWIFLPFDKYHRDLENLLNRKKTGLLSILATVIFLRNPLTISSILVYIVLGFLCARFIFPKSIQREISFYGHIIRDILFVISMFVFF